MYYDALMLREGNLTKAEKEMIVVATSAANNCMYCVVAHGAVLRIMSKNPLLGDQVSLKVIADKEHGLVVRAPVSMFQINFLHGSFKTSEINDY